MFLVLLIFQLLLTIICINFQELEEKIYSQNGEDGILMSLLKLIGIKTRSYVEFGVSDGSECNTRILREKFNFTGLLMDSDYENESIGLRKEFITEQNIITIFQKYNISKEFDVLSIDLDMFDL